MVEVQTWDPLKKYNVTIILVPPSVLSHMAIILEHINKNIVENVLIDGRS